jgi:oligopeptide transport system substrate-binding protein
MNLTVYVQYLGRSAGKRRTAGLLVAIAIITVGAWTVTGANLMAATDPVVSGGDSTYADYDPATGVYRDTLRGFSLKLPAYWIGNESTTGREFLTAVDNEAVPTSSLQGFAFNSSGNDASSEIKAIVDSAVASGSTLISSEPIEVPADTTGHRAVAEWTHSSGLLVRDDWSAFVKGSNLIVLKLQYLGTNYGIKKAEFDETVGSFAWEVPAPYGASKSDSLFLAGGEIRTIDPALYRGSTGGIPGEIFSGLVMLSPDIEVTPEIATHWDIDDTGTVYTFHLDPLAVFHDGRQITAADVKYSWERAPDPATESPTVLTYLGDIVGIAEMQSGEADHVTGIEAVDDVTLRVTISRPIQYFLQKLTYPTAFIVDSQAIEAGGDDWTDVPNGSGPFKIKRWDKDEVLVLERFEQHNTGAPKLQHIVYLLFSGIPMTMYENGEIDMVGVGGSQIDRVMDPANPLNADLITGDNYCTMYMWFNSSTEPFDDKNVRQAFAMAIDIDKIVEVSYKGLETRATALLPPGIPGYRERDNTVVFNPDAARQLLGNSSIRDSSIPSYGIPGSFHWMWETYLDISFTSIQVMEPQDAVDRRDAGELLFGIEGWCADYPDPQNFLEILFHSESQENSKGYSNPDFDELVDRAALETDPEIRNELYQQAEDILLDSYAIVPLWRGTTRFLAKPWVKNVVVAPIGVRTNHLIEIVRR